MNIKAIFDPKIEFNPSKFEFTDPIFSIISDVEFYFSNKEGIVLCETSPLHLLFSFLDYGIELFYKGKSVNFNDLFGSGSFIFELKNKDIVNIKFTNSRLNFEVKGNSFYAAIYEFGESLFSDLIFKFNGFETADQLKNMKSEFDVSLKRLSTVIFKIK